MTWLNLNGRGPPPRSVVSQFVQAWIKAARVGPRRLRDCYRRASPDRSHGAGGFARAFDRRQSAAFEQRLDIRLTPGEVAEQLHGILAAALGKERIPEMIAVFTRQSTVLLEPLDAVGVQHFTPDVGVIACRIAAHDVREVGGAVA